MSSYRRVSITTWKGSPR